MTATARPDERLHALDAVRGAALLLGIVLHATMSFFFVIPARDDSQSTALAVLFYAIHTFRLSLFFLIAGFFGHLVYHRRGMRAFAKDRARRIVVPLTVGWLLLAPPTIAAVAWGLSRTFPTAASGSAQALPPQGFPLVHLWFLYYLALLYILVLAGRWVVETAVDRTGRLRGTMDRWLRVGLSSGVMPVLLAAPLAGVLCFDASWVLWFGIPTPDNGLAPQLPALVAYGTAFTFGWALHRQQEPWRVVERRWLFNLVIAAGLTGLCLVLVGVVPDLAAPTAIDGGPSMRALYAAAFTVSIWYWTLGLIGLALRFWAGPSPVRRYLADSSYWLYLVHPPIVFGLQALVMHLPFSWAIKFPAILVVTMAVLLVSYHWLVRSTLIGEILNGRRYPRKLPAFAADAAAGAAPGAGRPVAETMDVAALDRVTKRYGSTIALDRLSLSVGSGELLALLGPNGAGKTTAIGLWLGTLEADQGRVTLLGGSPLEVARRLGVGVMMQEVSLAPMLTGRELIVLTAGYYPDPFPVEEVIALAGLGALADRRYGGLSTGQKRQVQFAVAVCGRPRLLFLDEPTVGLDVEAREAMWRTIRTLRRDGCAIVLTTHYLEEAEALADRVAVVARGRLVAQGSVEEMRALVASRRISAVSALGIEEIRAWPGVVDVAREARTVHVTAFDAESVVRRLLQADPTLSNLEVKQASLAEAFTELTREAA